MPRRQTRRLTRRPRRAVRRYGRRSGIRLARPHSYPGKFGRMFKNSLLKNA